MKNDYQNLSASLTLYALYTFLIKLNTMEMQNACASVNIRFVKLV